MTYWMVFDSKGKQSLIVAGTEWESREAIEERILKNPELTKTGGSPRELATAAGLPPDAFEQTVRRYNEQIDRGEDVEFGRFRHGMAMPAPGQKPPTSAAAAPLPPKIANPPYYAIQMFPLARKSLGGLRVDAQARVLDKKLRPIPGLFAAGEVTGFAGINGKAGLEGTFLGPCIFTGRVAGRSAAASVAIPPSQTNVPPVATTPAPAVSKASAADCATCHDLPALVKNARPGYWHFERVHTRVLAEHRRCQECHVELTPYDPAKHHIDRLQQIQACTTCHASHAK